MPFFIPDKDDPRLKLVLVYFDQISTLYQQHDLALGGRHENAIRTLKDSIDNLVLDLYDLFPIDRQLVYDMVEYGLGFFSWMARKHRKLNDPKFRAVRRPNTQMLVEYAETFIETVKTCPRSYAKQT